MTKSTQAEIWRRLHENLEQYGNFYKNCKAPMPTELEQIFEDMCEKFEATLAEDQREIFIKLIDISATINVEHKESGIAFGFSMARELRKLLAHPGDAFQQANTTYPTATELVKHDIKALESYLEKRKAVSTHND